MFAVASKQVTLVENQRTEVPAKEKRREGILACWVEL